MKYLLSLTIFLSSLNANAFFYEEQDKNRHVVASFGLTYIGTTALLATTDMKSREAAIWAGAAVLLVGLAKESLHDDKFDLGDMGANLAGVGMGSIPFIVINF